MQSFTAEERAAFKAEHEDFRSRFICVHLDGRSLEFSLKGRLNLDPTLMPDDARIAGMSIDYQRNPMGLMVTICSSHFAKVPDGERGPMPHVFKSFAEDGQSMSIGVLEPVYLTGSSGFVSWRERPPLI